MRTRFGWSLALSLVLLGPGATSRAEQSGGAGATEPSLSGEERDEQQAQEQKPEEKQEQPEDVAQEPARLPPYHEVVTVTATREEQPLGEVVSMVTVLTRVDLDAEPALVLDDHLRRVPGFSLFRRSSSLVSHPTTQGVSLRGIGPSGTSRSLVLWDGIPFNDPLGGWVYWNRIPALALEAVEVARGATSQLYGSTAMGGTLELRPRAPAPATFDARARLGNRQTYDVDVLASDRRGELGWIVSGRAFDTDGFFIVREEERGPVDTRARVGFQSFFGRLEYKNAHAGVNLYREERNNGTHLQVNDSWMALVDGGVDGTNWSARAYTQVQRFDNVFSRILPDRSQEFKTAEQHFPVQGVGGAFSWRPAEGLLVGADWRQARWEERRQNLGGVFVQTLRPVGPRVDLLAGVRFDLWENRTTQTSVNPRAGVLVRASSAVTLRGSVYRGFRAPTLNELYRPFRVGNVLTRANEDLGEERLVGAEAGVDLHPSRSVLVRINGFWNSLDDPVSNVTLSVTPELVLRQRQNLGGATIKGLESELRLRIAERWWLSGAYLFSDAVDDETGLRLPQVPRHRGSVALDYRGPVSIRGDLIAVGEQFEDDRNELPLGAYWIVNIQASRRLSPTVELFVAAENLFDREYAVGRLPEERLGTPRLVHGGVRFRLSR